MAIESPKKRRLWTAIYIAAVLLVSLPYIVSFRSQLVSDDFILLYYYGRLPLWKLGAFFSPRTIWTYHPLQDLYYSLCWHLSGIEPWSYRAFSLVFHLGTTLLLMRLARDLTGSVHFGGCTAVAFASAWRPWEAVAWAGSIATIQSTFFAALACTAFLNYLVRRRPTYYALTLLAGVGWFFSKETIVQFPLFLAAIYLYYRWMVSKAPPEQGGVFAPAPTTGETGKKPARTAWAEMAKLLAAPIALVFAYLFFYAFFVVNTYTFKGLGYKTSPLGSWPANVLCWFDRSLNPFVNNDVAYEVTGGLKMFLWLARHHIVSIAAVAATLYLAVLRGRMLPLLGLGMSLVGMIPYFALRFAFAGSRYHYAAMFGEALWIVALGREIWRTTAGKRGGWASWLRVGVAAGGGLWVVANLAQLTYWTLRDAEGNRVVRQLYDFFASQKDKADRRVLFIVDGHEAENLVDVEIGWGLLECARLATESDKTAAVELGFDLDPGWLENFNSYGERYLVRYEKDHWRSMRVPEDVELTVPAGRGGRVELGQRR